MSVTAPAPTRGWARTHRAVLAVVLLSIALATAVGMLAARLSAGPPPVPATSVTHVPLLPVDDGFAVARPGQPC